MTIRRFFLLLTALAVLGVPAAAGHADPGHAPPGRPLGPADPGLFRGQGGTLAPGTFRGIDGQVHESAPSVVQGTEGALFFGGDYDVACGIGDRLRTPLARLASLAHDIERTGRRVVFTMAPNKVQVGTTGLPARPPHGRCDKHGVAAQDRVLDTFRDPSYLPLRRLLGRHGSGVYWLTDPHWTTYGASRFTTALADRLDPRIGRHQSYRYGTESRVGLLTQMLGGDQPETVRTATPAENVQVRARPDSPWDGYPSIIFDHSWSTTPAKRTLPGHTLFLGDSFGWYALENLRPIVRHGRFMWDGHTDPADMVRAIKQSDTVVVEIYSTFAMSSDLITNGFRRKVQHALAMR